MAQLMTTMTTITIRMAIMKLLKYIHVTTVLTAINHIDGYVITIKKIIYVILCIKLENLHLYSAQNMVVILSGLVIKNYTNMLNTTVTLQ